MWSFVLFHDVFGLGCSILFSEKTPAYFCVSSSITWVASGSSYSSAPPSLASFSKLKSLVSWIKVHKFDVLNAYVKHRLKTNFWWNHILIVMYGKLLEVLNNTFMIISNIFWLSQIHLEIIKLKMFYFGSFFILSVRSVKHWGLAPNQFQILVPNTHLQWYCSFIPFYLFLPTWKVVFLLGTSRMSGTVSSSIL